MKRSVVIVMFVIVALLSAGAIFIGLRLRQPESTLPDYIFAEGNNCCNEPDYQVCDEDAEWVAGYNACVAGGCAQCQGGGPQCGNGQCESGENSNNCTADCGCPATTCGNNVCECGEKDGTGGTTQCSSDCGTGGGACNIDNPSVSSGCITLNGQCSGATGMRYVCNAAAGSTNEDCVGCNQNGSSISVGGSVCPNAPCGKCVQIDVVFQGNAFGTAAYGGDCPTNPSCGNGVVEGSESCDPGDPDTADDCGTGSTCTSTCTCGVTTTETGIVKTANQSCNPGGTTSTVTYTITATNSGSASITVDIVDSLDPEVTAYIDEDSIDGGGIFNEAGDEIAWADQTIAAGDDVTFTYTASIPRTVFGTVLTNTVAMNEGSEVLDSADASITPTCELPETALISDSVDRILVGVLLVLFGVLIVRFDLMGAGYKLFMNMGGRNIVANFDENERKVATDKKARKMEKRMLK